VDPIEKQAEEVKKADEVKRRSDDVEVESLRQELREWQGRRIALAVATPGVVLVVIGASVGLDPWKVWFASAALFAVLIAISNVIWYGAYANSVGVAYLTTFHKGFLWESYLADLRQAREKEGKPTPRSLNQVLAASQLGLGAFVLVYCAKSAWSLGETSWDYYLEASLVALLGTFAVWLWVVFRLLKSPPGARSESAPAKRWAAVNAIRSPKLQEIDYKVLELKAIRNEMRDWQSRRIVIAASALTLAGASATLALKTGAPGAVYPVCQVGLAGFFALSHYAHCANWRCAEYLKAQHQDFLWERHLQQVTESFRWLGQSPSLQQVLQWFYVCLYTLIAIAWVVQARMVMNDNRWWIALGGFAVVALLPAFEVFWWSKAAEPATGNRTQQRQQVTP
jgi:hypothetical protein